MPEERIARPGKGLVYKKGGIMCLSNVYVDTKKQENLVLQEVVRVSADGEDIRIQTLIGDSKRMEGYYIRQVDFMENYMILEKKGKANA
ncbi:MAG: CooT family nickel-binding protein [bacterium]